MRASARVAGDGPVAPEIDTAGVAASDDREALEVPADKFDDAALDGVVLEDVDRAADAERDEPAGVAGGRALPRAGSALPVHAPVTVTRQAARIAVVARSTGLIR